MRGIRPTDRVLVVGQTGFGKSTLAMHIVQGLQPIRTLVVDPKHDYDFPGVPIAHRAEQLDMRLPWIHYVPADADDREDLEAAYARAWRTRGPLLLFDDEFAETSDSNWAAKGLTSQVRLGRKILKPVVACTQRLAECHPIMRSQAEHIFVVVPAPPELDLKMLAGSIGRPHTELRARLDQLEAQKGLYSHLWFVRPGNELRLCEPLPTPAGPGQPRPAAALPAQPRPTPTALEDGQVDSSACGNSDSPSERS